MTETMNALFASSTWTRLGAIALSAFGVLSALGLAGTAEPEMVQDVVDKAEATATAASDLWLSLIALGGGLGLWGIGDAQRAVGKKDLTIGNTVVSRAGGA